MHSSRQMLLHFVPVTVLPTTLGKYTRHNISQAPTRMPFFTYVYMSQHWIRVRPYISLSIYGWFLSSNLRFRKAEKLP